MTPRFRYIPFVVILLACIVFTGCFGGRRPLFEYGPTGLPIQVKRTPRYPQIDNIHRFRHTAYKHNINGDKAKPNSDEQIQILEELGQPDYIRRPFKSQRGDRVYEWAYLEKNKLFQFVDHVLVFEDRLTDKDRVLIQWGYPDMALLQDDLLGSRRETFIYDADIDTQLNYFSFTNDQLIFGKLAY